MIYRPQVVPKSKQINLVLSGTGALYPTHAGAISALIDLGYSFKAISGTSGGAIVGAAIAGGTTPDRLKRMLLDYNPWPKLLSRFELPFGKNWGIYSNKECEFMFDKLGGGTTFKQSKIPIHIVATQIIPNHERIIFNAENSPDMTLTEATKISTCLPVLWRPITTKGGKVMIDGTFADDLCIEPFEDDFENTIAIDLRVRSVQHPTTFWQYLKLCISMLIAGQGAGTYTPKNLTVIPIEVHNYSTFKFRLTRNDKLQLFETGYNAVIKHLSSQFRLDEELGDYDSQEIEEEMQHIFFKNNKPSEKT